MPVNDSIPALRQEIRRYFRTRRYRWGQDVGKVVLAVCRRTSDRVFVWTSPMHGIDILGESIESFESEFMPFLLERERCHAIRVHVRAGLAGVTDSLTVDAWLYVRGADQEEAASNLIADSVIES